MKKLLSILVLAVAILAVSCESKPSPSDVVLDIYNNINAGNYEAVVEDIYIRSEMPEVIADKKAKYLAMFVKDVAPQYAAKNGIASTEILNETIVDDEKAIVEAKVVYGNGTEKIEKINIVIDSEGEWKWNVGIY